MTSLHMTASSGTGGRGEFLTARDAAALRAAEKQKEAERQLKEMILTLHRELMQMLPHCQERSNVTGLKLVDAITKDTRLQKLRQDARHVRSVNDYDFDALLCADLAYLKHFNRYYKQEDATMRNRMKERLRQAVSRSLKQNRTSQTDAGAAGGAADATLILSPFADLTFLDAVREERMREMGLPTLPIQQGRAASAAAPGQRGVPPAPRHAAYPLPPPPDVTARDCTVTRERRKMRKMREQGGPPAPLIAASFAAGVAACAAMLAR
eukprot:gene21014-65177_t